MKLAYKKTGYSIGRFNMDFLKRAEAIGLEEDEFMELVELFINTTISDLNRLKNALEEKDLDEVISSSHSIKGASGNMGFMDISEVARVVELKGKDGSMDGAEEAIDSIREKIDALAVELGSRKDV